MLDAAKFADQFLTHVRNCPSGRVACSFEAAFESWFLVELATMMVVSGTFDYIECGYCYPGSREKADMMAEIGGHRIVFELKCFVSRADSNKLDKWPGQIAQLSSLVRDDHARQCVAVSTFSQYKKERLSGFLRKSHPSPWDVAGPYGFYEAEETPLQLVVATLNTAQKEIGA